MSIKLGIRHSEGVRVVDVSGRITLGEGCSTLRDAVREMVSLGDKKILLNLADVSQIDSSGLGELVTAFVTVSNQGGKLKLVNLPSRVQGLLQITKLYTVFDIFDSEATAMRSFAL
jgi:anti-sigma B factor antagonist